MENFFAIVQFTKTLSYQEIPATWLLENNSMCFWPKQKTNLSNKIKNRVVPDEKWQKYSVTLECLCETYEKARKKAQDAHFISTTETEGEEISEGRGKRLKIKKHFDDEDTDRESETESEDEESVISKASPPPKLNKLPKSKDIANNGNGLSDNGDAVSDRANTLEVFDIALTENIDIGLDIGPFDDGPSNHVHNIDVTKTIDLQQLQTSLDGMARDLDNLKRTSSEILLFVKNIDKHMSSTNNSKPLESGASDFQIIEKFIPINDVEQLSQFEDFLNSSKENEVTFVAFLKKIGGRHSKEILRRVLQTVFTNSFGILCSWLGLRKNLKAKEFKIMKVIKACLVGGHMIENDRDFETYASQWFRLSKLRQSREKL